MHALRRVVRQKLYWPIRPPAHCLKRIKHVVGRPGLLRADLANERINVFRAQTVTRQIAPRLPDRFEVAPILILRPLTERPLERRPRGGSPPCVPMTLLLAEPLNGPSDARADAFRFDPWFHWPTFAPFFRQPHQ
jgi:hypothetical protein